MQKTKHASLMLHTFRALFFVLLMGTSISIKAADDFGIELDDLDQTIESDESNHVKPSQSRGEQKKEDLKTLSDLATLAPFQDVAVIQRRYFTKTGRFESYLAGTAVMNDAFFLNAGGATRLAYYFSESWGIEASLVALFNAERGVTKSLGTRGVVTSSLVSPKLFYGADIKWIPVYGKMAFRDQRIIPFDLYFSIGGGLTQTNQEGSGGSAPTIHIGSGQSFAINKTFAFRWDFSWNFYTPKTASDAAGSSGTFNNLYLTLGFSFYFPETKYR